MSETSKKHIVFLLLLCIAVNFVPFKQLHNHEEDLRICDNHVEGELNPCHETIFHKDSSENNCIHESHISNKKEACEFCKFITTRRYQFILTENSIPSIIKNYEVLINTETSIALTQLNRCIKDRAPPIF